MPDARIQLQSTAGAGTPTFSFGCGSGNGTSACDLGEVDASSSQRLFQAEVTVPLTATTVTAVSLTVTGSAANLATDPAATAPVIIQAGTTSLSAMPLPSITTPTPTLSSGGSAADLFPTVAPGSTKATGETPVANVSRLSSGTPVGSEIAELTGLAALAVAMFLAVTRLSFRRPARQTANSTVAAASTVAAPPQPDAPAERHEKAD